MLFVAEQGHDVPGVHSIITHSGRYSYLFLYTNSMQTQREIQLSLGLETWLCEELEDLSTLKHREKPHEGTKEQLRL